MRIRRQAILLALQLAGAAAMCLGLLVLAARHNVRIDLTPGHTQSLAGATHAVLARLDRDVTITVFYDGQAAGRRREMADLLERYESASPRIEARLLDLDRHPGLARRLGVTRYGTGVAAADGVVPLAVVDEEEITGALLRFVDPADRALYFTVGHGEHDPTDGDERRGYSELARSLQAEGYATKRLETLVTTGVPADAAAVVVGGPRAAFPDTAFAALRRYVGGGGAVLLLLDPGTPPAFADFLATYGLRLSEDAVVDERNALLGADNLMPRIPYLNQSVFPRLTELPAALPEAQSVAIGDAPAGVETTYLASSAEDAWADVNHDRVATESPRFTPGEDHRGPIPVAALIRVAAAEGGRTGDIAIVGDADFATNLYLGLLGNRDFFLVLLDLLTRRELRGALRPMEPGGSFSALSLTRSQDRFVFWTAVILPPALVLLAWAAATAARRRRPH
jgi:ABC-type uncharacterized transport system involved in gliding motility auxiliary subunit